MFHYVPSIFLDTRKITRNPSRSDLNWRCWVNEECHHCHLTECDTSLVDRYRYFGGMWHSHWGRPKPFLFPVRWVPSYPLLSSSLYVRQPDYYIKCVMCTFCFQSPWCHHCYRYNLWVSYRDWRRFSGYHESVWTLQISQFIHQSVLPTSRYTCSTNVKTPIAGGSYDQSCYTLRYIHLFHA